MKTHRKLHTAEKAAKKFFVDAYGKAFAKAEVGYEKKNGVYSFYSKQDSGLPETYDCIIK
jgi:hypothetical protein